MSKTFLSKTAGLFVSLVVAFSLNETRAQEPFAFHCRDYVSTDNNRAPQSAFSYDEEANTLVINGFAGANNVAFQMDKSKDNAYSITNDRVWMVVSGTNLSADLSKKPPVVVERFEP